MSGVDISFPDYESSDRQQCTLGEVLACTVVGYVVSVILVLSLSLGLGTEPRSIRSSEVYALTDNRLISYRGDFCVNLRATSTEEPRDNQSTASATLAFLRSRPPLTGREVFNLSVNASLNQNITFTEWNFYLNHNSNASIRVCYQNFIVSSVTFYVVKSTENFGRFDAWLEHPDNVNPTDRSIRLSRRCYSISYQVVGDGVYYFILHLSGQRSTSLDIVFEFNRTLYEVSSDMVVKNCSFPLDRRSQCTLDAPMTPGYTGFLSLNAEPPVDYNDGAGISISCSPRGWLYAVIVLVVLFVTLCLPCACVSVAVYVWCNHPETMKQSEIPRFSVGPPATNITTPSVRCVDEPATVSHESIRLREIRNHPSFVPTKSVPVGEKSSSIPADSVLAQEEPPSYSDAAECSNVASNTNAPPPSYESTL